MRIDLSANFFFERNSKTAYYCYHPIRVARVLRQKKIRETHRNPFISRLGAENLFKLLLRALQVGERRGLVLARISDAAPSREQEVDVFDALFDELHFVEVVEAVKSVLHRHFVQQHIERSAVGEPVVPHHVTAVQVIAFEKITKFLKNIFSAQKR